MAPSRSAETHLPGTTATTGTTGTTGVQPPDWLSPAEQEMLLDIAASSLVGAFDGRAPCVPGGLSPALGQRRDVFVTLNVHGKLNGCIGAIGGDEPLGSAVARLVRSAAFEDPRLPATRREDLPHLEIEISVLSPMEPISAADPADVIGHLRPGVHGLVLAAEGRRALFLPSVWDKLPRPDEFVGHLLAKAGLPPDRWPSRTEAWRFTTQTCHR